jgi:hypothetical protein
MDYASDAPHQREGARMSRPYGRCHQNHGWDKIQRTRLGYQIQIKKVELNVMPDLNAAPRPRCYPSSFLLDLSQGIEDVLICARRNPKSGGRCVLGTRINRK